MMEHSKILTVSYGTFSCTLEGFEDSVDTMRAIAEYFRDLAADDRFFGAEPPTPDAAILTRIAEAQLSRRVAAHPSANGITLRPIPEAAAAAQAATGDGTACAPEADLAPALETATDDLPETPLTETAADAWIEDARSDTGRDNENVAQSAPDAPQAAAAEPDSEPDGPEAAAADDPEDAAEEPILDWEDLETGDKSASAPGGDGSSQRKEAADEDTLADKLARIRAVVAQQNSAVTQPAPSADAQPVANAPDLTDVPEADLDDTQPMDDADETAAFEATQPGTAIRGVHVKHGARQSDTDPAPLKKKKKKHRKRKKHAEALAQAAKPAPLVLEPHRRVAASTAGADMPQTDPGGLSAEEEDDLMRALAEVEAEVVAQTAPTDLLDAATEEAHASSAPETDRLVTADAKSPARRARRAARIAQSAAETDDDHDDDNDVARLMATAEAQMAEPAGRSRRNAMAQMRAAVAATKEERQGDAPAETSGQSQPEDAQDVMRLNASLVAASPAAPLKLVAEQRVDPAEDDVSTQSVSPRRIAPRRPERGESITSGTGASEGFLDFARDRGAQDLPEVMEAAAAFLTARGQDPHFSRTELMQTVRQAEDKPRGREDRLRIFGTLLRQGKIEKTGPGRFVATDRIAARQGERGARAAG